MKSGLDICKEARDTLWHVSGLNYDKACKMIEELNKVKGIYANITVGGTKISCGGFVDVMKEIVGKYEICPGRPAVPCKGLTRMVETVLLRGDTRMKPEPLEDPGVKSTPRTRLARLFQNRKFRAEMRKIRNKARRRAKSKQHRTT